MSFYRLTQIKLNKKRGNYYLKKTLPIPQKHRTFQQFAAILQRSCNILGNIFVATLLRYCWNILCFWNR